MSRRKPKIEILPPARSGATLPERVEDAINRAVEEKLGEALGKPDLMQPWFRSKRKSAEIRRSQSVPEQRKWTVYFERFGCLVCRKSNRSHAGNGLCRKCRSEVHRRLEAIVKELERGRS